VDYIANVSEENSVSIFRVVLFLDNILRERGKVTYYGQYQLLEREKI
jgi:hypothetical protein